MTPEGAAAKIEAQRREITGEPKNLEEQAISLVGRDIYEALIKGYTEKKWGPGLPGAAQLHHPAAAGALHLGGSLGEYKYYDMDAVIAAALKKSGQELGE